MGERVQFPGDPSDGDEVDAEIYDTDDLEIWDDPEEVIDEDVVLVFSDDSDEPLDLSDCELLAADILGEYTMEELLELNETTEADLLARLFYDGNIGFPSEVDDEVSGDETPPEEEENF